MYHEKFHSSMDEMKMHKLMYFTQLESLMYNKEPLFDEDFYGWKYGPVLKSVRHEYLTGSLFKYAADLQPDCPARCLLKSVLDRYGSVSSWKLSNLSHEQFSWQRARKDLAPSDNGDTKLSLNAMMIDAIHELSERKSESV